MGRWELLTDVTRAVGRQIDALLPARIRGSYALKFSLALLVIVLVIAVVGYVAQGQLSAILRDDVRQTLTVQTQTEASEFDDWLRGHKTTARVLSDDTRYAETNASGITGYLTSQRAKLSGSVVAVHYVRSYQARIVASSDRDRVGDNVSRLAWTDRLKFRTFDTVVVSDPYTNVNGKPVIAFVSPANEVTGHLLVVTVDVNHMDDNFRNPFDGGFTHVVDSTGTVIFAENQSETLSQYVAAERQSPAVRAAIDNGSGFRQQGLKEQSYPGDYVLSYAQIGGTDWTIVKHAPTETAYRLATRTQTVLIVFVLVTLVGVLLVGGVLGLNTSAALSRLSAKANALEREEYDVSLRTDRADEIGTLYDSFASMRGSLAEKIEQLERTNEAIEERNAVISVLNRVLRHNLRNDMTVVLGRAELLASRVPDDTAKHVEDIDEMASELIEKADKARQIDDIMGDEESTNVGTIDLVSITDEEINRARSEFPEAAITLEAPDSAPIVAHRAFSFVIGNLIENAIEHNDSGSPTVEVKIDTGEEWTSLRVRDDGPGIPDTEIESISKREETSLQHGSGLGLWLVDLIVEESDGSLSFTDREPTGTVVTVELQSADADALDSASAGTDIPETADHDD